MGGGERPGQPGDRQPVRVHPPIRRHRAQLLGRRGAGIGPVPGGRVRHVPAGRHQHAAHRHLPHRSGGPRQELHVRPQRQGGPARPTVQPRNHLVRDGHHFRLRVAGHAQGRPHGRSAHPQHRRRRHQPRGLQRLRLCADSGGAEARRGNRKRLHDHAGAARRRDPGHAQGHARGRHRADRGDSDRQDRCERPVHPAHRLQGPHRQLAHVHVGHGPERPAGQRLLAVPHPRVPEVQRQRRRSAPPGRGNCAGHEPGAGQLLQLRLRGRALRAGEVGHSQLRPAAEPVAAGRHGAA